MEHYQDPPLFVLDRRSLARLVALLIAASAVVLVASGCAEQSRSAAKAPVPVALSYPYDNPLRYRFPGHRETAHQAKRAYVALTIYRKNPETATVSDKADGIGGAGQAAGIIVVASGIIVDRAGHIVTAAHIAKSLDLGARVRTADGRIREARILHLDPKRELALLRIRPFQGMTPAVLADSDQLRRFDPALVIGTPKLTAGVVSVGSVRLPKRKTPLDYGAYRIQSGVELDMEVDSGHSGGPVIGADGSVIGMLAGYLLGDTSQTPYVSPEIAFAVPANMIRAYLKERIAR